MKKISYIANFVFIVLIIVLLTIFFSEKENKSANNAYDKELTNDKIKTATQVFVADPLFELYTNNRPIDIRMFQRGIRYVYYKSISLDLVGIWENKGVDFRYMMIIYNGSNGFYHIFPLMDEYYYFQSNFPNNSHKGCCENLREPMYQIISLEKHLNFIFSQDKFFNSKVDKLRKYKRKMFLKLVFEKVLHCKGISKCNYDLLHHHFDENKNYFKYFDFELIKKNYKRVEMNLCSSDMMYFITKQSIYEVDLKNECVNIELLNKELFYWPIF